MKLRKKMKKGFTLVELVVVIAVIAILAAVSTVSYFAIVDKANLSNDQQMVKMMNDSLLLEGVTEKPTSPKDAMEDLYTQGFYGDKLNPFSRNHHYAYSLENNKMYLLDKADQVVYPENGPAVNTLWGFYRNADGVKIDGVTKYIALESVTSPDKFKNVFGETGDFKLDLNNNIITISGRQDIKVDNGTVLPGLNFGSEAENNVQEKKMTSFTAESTVSEGFKLDKNNTAIVEDYYVSIKDNVAVGSVSITSQIKKEIEKKQAEGKAITELTIKGFVFDGKETSNVTDLSISGIKKINIINCKFINFKHWALKIGQWETETHLINCEFTNTDRGVNINPAEGGWYQTAPATGNSIEGCTFSLRKRLPNKDLAIQLASWYNFAKTTKESNPEGNQSFANIVLDTDGNWTPIWTIKNNTMKNGTAFILLNETFLSTEYKTTGTGEDVTYYEFSQLTGDQLAKAFKVEGNTIGNDVKSVKGDDDIPAYDTWVNALKEAYNLK